MSLPAAPDRELADRLREAEETIRAIASGSVDALVLQDGGRAAVYAIETADRPYRLMVESMQEGAVTLGRRGQVLYANGRFAEIVKRPLSRVIGQSIEPMVADSDLATLRGLIEAATREPVRTGLTLVDGTGAAVSCAVSAVPLPVGDEVSAALIVTDVTEQSAARQALRESEARFRGLVENSLDTILILDDLERLMYASPSAERVLGYGVSDIVGSAVDGLVHPDDLGRLHEALQGSARVGSSSRVPDDFRIRHRNGTWRLMEIAALDLLSDPAVRGVVLTCRDVTGQRALEERLNRSERLEAVGQLAGGVAHDFNNVLLVIRGYATMLRSSLDDPQLLADVDEIVSAVDRAAQLTRQLLAFGRRQDGQPMSVDIADVIVDLESLLRRTIREDIELVLRVPEACPTVLGDQSQIEQVLLNLVVNARDAMPRGGTVTIEIGTAELSGDEDTTPRLAAGRYVAISVADTGTGIPSEVLPHIFEPFFTTKAEGEGTGLGLATVHAIVAENGGGVAVESSPAGTVFRTYLPAVAGDASRSGLESAGPPAGAATGVVVLAEDESSVRQLVLRLLEEEGHRVLVAATPAEALEAVSGSGVIDLLLTDVVMPEMSGYELADRARLVRPDLPVLFMSGYAESLPSDGSQLLRKPFAPGDLLAAVDAAIAASSRPAA